ncbi:MAG: hypothetical protein O6931_02630 [Gammaproteobacteria bacterium]|nr:hypothetical protein [Gammaproteobacteria bacterium]
MSKKNQPERPAESAMGTSCMERFDNWLHRINEGRIDATLQREIADKILELLEKKKDSRSTRIKTLFAEAITELSISVNSIYQPAEAGLKRCLITLKKVMIPEKEPADPHAQGDDADELINYPMLVATVKKLQEEIDRTAQSS